MAERERPVVFDNWQNLGYKDRMEGFVNARDEAIRFADQKKAKPTQFEGSSMAQYAKEEDRKTKDLQNSRRDEKIDPITHPVAAANYETARREEELDRDAYWRLMGQLIAGEYPFSQYLLEQEINEIREGRKSMRH